MKIINKIHEYRTNGSWYQRPVGNIDKITVHHSAIQQGGNDEQVLKTIQNIHQGQGWPGLAYHFCILPNGSIYQTNAYTDITWHDAINSDSIGILVHGYFHYPYNEQPTEDQLRSLRALLDHLCTEHPEFPASHGDVVGHRERSSTACPGDNLIPYVVEYRTSGGAVHWGEEPVKEDKFTAYWEDLRGYKLPDRAPARFWKELKLLYDRYNVPKN